LLDAYSSTLTVSVGRTNWVISSAAEEFSKEMKSTIWSRKDSKCTNNPEEDRYLDNLITKIRGRAFFETTNGYIGVTSADVKTGDRIYVLLGGEAPFILRALPENPALNQVVGPCYLQGIMFGEALLGEIPPIWTCSRDRKSGEWQFTNKETGKRTFRDPRLGPLQPEWELHYCNDASCCAGDCVEENDGEIGFVRGWFLNRITGEATWDDPRLSGYELKCRGIKVEDVILV